MRISDILTVLCKGQHLAKYLKALSFSEFEYIVCDGTIDNWAFLNDRIINERSIINYSSRKRPAGAAA